MTTVTYSDFRKNLALYLDRAEENHEEIIITRGKGRSSVLLPLEGFSSLQETSYLLSSPKNRLHLQKSLTEAREGKTRVMTF